MKTLLSLSLFLVGTEMSNEILTFARQLEDLAKKLRLTTLKGRGQKALGRRTRVELTEVKKSITTIKQTIMENEK